MSGQAQTAQFEAQAAQVEEVYHLEEKREHKTRSTSSANCRELVV
jgi:hypothetical protein